MNKVTRAQRERNSLLREIRSLKKEKAMWEIEVGKLQDIRGKLADEIKVNIDLIAFKSSQIYKKLS